MALKPRLNTPDKPLVSMMVFNYNYGRYLRECLDRLLAQTYDNIEICFSDNASTDDSWEIALEYQKRYPDVIFVARNRQNFGTDANFANCWTNARGKYFVEVCSDDALLPDFTERCVKALEEHVDAGFAMVHRTILDEHGKHVIEAPFYNQTCKIPGAGQAAVYMMAAVNPAVTQIMYRKLFTFGKSVTGGLAGRWYGTSMMDFKMCCECHTGNRPNDRRGARRTRPEYCLSRENCRQFATRLPGTRGLRRRNASRRRRPVQTGRNRLFLRMGG